MLSAGDGNAASLPRQEIERLRALEEYCPLHTPDPDIDRIIEIAARICGTPAAAFSLVGRSRVYLKSRHGIAQREFPRQGTFCEYAIEKGALFCVLDAHLDPRFATLPIVTGAPHVRFYAGIPLQSPSGHNIGAVCLLDVKPWPEFAPGDRKALEDVAALVMSRLEVQRVKEASLGDGLRFERIASTSPDAIVCTDALGRIIFWNKAAEAMTGYSAQEAMGNPVSFVFPPRLRRTQTAKLTRVVHRIAGPAAPRAEFTVLRRDGGELRLEMTLSVSRENDAGFGAILRDVGLARQGEQRLFARAELDPLTGLPNRCRLLAALRREAADGRGALFQLDLAGFKDVNDSLGHSAGDQLLRQSAERLTALIAGSGQVARLGADEFAVLLSGVSATDATKIAEKIIGAFDAPYFVGTEAIYLGVNVGIAMFPENGTHGHELATNANLALERSKATGRRGFEFFKPRMRQIVIARRTVEGELRQALAASQFELFYQPQVRLHDASIIGAEALLRWRHPTRGLLSPAAFLDNLEKSPLAGEVGNWVLRTACAQAAAWRKVHPNFRVAVNLFGAQFDAGDLPTRVEEALLVNGLPADALELEVTENIMLHGEHAIVVPLREMRAWGVGIAFDDYGTGFASLSLLKRFPVTRLKIDRSFVSDMCTGEEDAAIVQAIIYLGRCFQLGITAEGIEDGAQAEALRLYGCSEGQGYLYAEPLSVKALDGYLDRGESARSHNRPGPG